MTFSTLVTPTRDSETGRPGTCAWTSSSVISDIAPPRLVLGLPWVSDTNSRKNTRSDRTKSVSRATKPCREATESHEPRPDSRPASRCRTLDGRSDPDVEEGCARVDVPKDREGFGH